MNVLIIGSGGRESAIAWAVRKSPLADKLYIAPGNGGTLKYGENVHLSLVPPFDEVVDFVEDANVDLVIVGPEQPLVDGITDILERKGIRVFGPSKGAALLEGSKAYMKEFLAKYRIPTAKFKVFTDAEEAMKYVETENRAFVVKTDGLAAGKGAIVNKTIRETQNAIFRIMTKKEFGDAGNTIVVEDILEGTEVSVFIVTDGKDYRYLSSAQDHKRIFDNDEGPNTGGMGAYAPTPFIDENLHRIIGENIIAPTIKGLQSEGTPYRGILYIGLMLTKNGPTVLEYNARLGDPEAQVILPLLKTDFLKLCESVVDNMLYDLIVETYDGFCAGVVMAAGGYPDTYEKGKPITGDLTDSNDCFVFHAGSKRNEKGETVTSGGRVLCVSALGKTLSDAIDNAYDKVDKIRFDGMQFRKDIGQKGIDYYIKNKSK